MEKFGLFDLIDKFNSASSGKNDFSKTRPEEQTERKKERDGRIGFKRPRRKRAAAIYDERENGGVYETPRRVDSANTQKNRKTRQKAKVRTINLRQDLTKAVAR